MTDEVFMTINGKTTILGLMGDPVEHTLSPVIHNTFAEACGINAVYEAFNVKKGDTENAVKGGFSLGIQGFNVTVPHKEDVIPFLSGIDPAAEKIGAVNTLVRTESGYKGYNTDYLGIMRQIRKCGFDIMDQNVIMIGAGGAANACLAALFELGASKVYILNRSVEKAKEKFGSDNRVEVLPLDGFGNIPGEGLFCLQCTSVGLSPDTDGAPIEDEDFYKKINRAIDIIYNPAETLFMKKVREKGGRAENGMYMLLCQALISFKLFTGHEPGEEALKLAERALYEKTYT